MNVVVYGLWHLGSVTAACLAKHHRVTGLDADSARIAALQQGHAPLLEPGLDDLIAAGLKAGQLSFTTEVAAVAAAEVLWVCYDTPVDADDVADVGFVVQRIELAAAALRPGSLVLISSQLPVGTCAQLEKRFPQLRFACSPENLRLGKAIDAFEKPARIVVGLRDVTARADLERLLAPLGAPLLFMRTESAEMVKHALNSFLALSIAFINEIAAVCERTGADAQEVSAGLKSDPRIGPRAYLAAGGPFAGGTLARDIVAVSSLAHTAGLDLALIPAIKTSNDWHRGWTLRRVQSIVPPGANSVVAVLGLTYTVGTDTLRRSAAVELVRQLLAAGYTVRAYDPAVTKPEPGHTDIPLAPDPQTALRGAGAVVVCTEWPVFRTYDWPALLGTMARPCVLDPNRFLERQVQAWPGIQYITVGRT
jgi:UDPglucose 6-dehydrogenase